MAHSHAVSSPTHPRVVGAKLRDARVFELRVAGWSFDRIAAEVGFTSKAGAFASFKRAHKRSVEQGDRSIARERDIDLARIDALLASLWLDALGESTYVDDFGKTRATSDTIVNEARKRARELIAERAKLLGTAAPVRVEQKTALVDVDGKALPIVVVPAIADVAAWASAAARVAQPALAPPDKVKP